MGNKKDILNLELHNFSLKDEIYEESRALAKLDESELEAIKKRAKLFVEKLKGFSVNSEEFRDYQKAIYHLADEASRANLRAVNHFLDRPAIITSTNNFNNINPVSNNLTKLKEILENELDPKNISKEKTKKLFGIFEIKNDVLKEYFLRFQKKQFDIKIIMDILSSAHLDIDKDNASLEVEKQHIVEHITRIEKYIFFAIELEKALKNEMENIKRENLDKSYVIEREFLEIIRQKRKDLIKRQALNLHGYKIYNYLEENNNELIKGIDEIVENITFTLNSAIKLAQKLANQKINLDELKKPNYTNFIKTNHNSCAITKEHKSINSIEELKESFKRNYEIIDAVNEYKKRALTDIENSTQTLKKEVEKLKKSVKIESFTPTIRNQILFN